jgi:polar amino acid transport system substrate-binding protein
MMAFQELINAKSIDVSYLISHVFNLDDASDAYQMMMDRSEPFTGILIEYDINKKTENKPIFISKQKALSSYSSAVTIGFIGAGSYAQSHLLPNISQKNEIKLKGVMTATGTSSRSVAERFGFEFCTSNVKDILDNDEINTVFIATRHESHAEYVLNALKAGKHVFVEKPLCLSDEELGQIVELLNIKIAKDSASTHQPQSSLSILMVGYNRRFSPLAKIIKEKFNEGPMAITYRVNAGAIPPDSWIQDQDIGGGRVIGEVCHFLDFLTYISGSLPKSIYANVLSESNHLNDTLTVSLSYKNGSIGTISYFANGDTSLPKERVEIFVNGCSAIIDDFKSLTIHAGGKKTTKNLLSQNKGQKHEVRIFLDNILKGRESPIPLDEIYSTSLVTFKIIESLKSGEAIIL